MKSSSQGAEHLSPTATRPVAQSPAGMRYESALYAIGECAAAWLCNAPADHPRRTVPVESGASERLPKGQETPNSRESK
jgi:hypothetical protein